MLHYLEKLHVIKLHLGGAGKIVVFSSEFESNLVSHALCDAIHRVLSYDLVAKFEKSYTVLAHQYRNQKLAICK